MDERYGRRQDEEFGSAEGRHEPEGRRYRGEGYYGGYYQPGHERERGPVERGFLERAGDEVRSWFGDEAAERRRRQDERERRASAWSEGDRWSRGRPEAHGDERWAAGAGAGRDWDDTGRGPERGYGERWLGADREQERTWPVPRGSGWDFAGGSTELWTTRGRFTGRGPKGYQRSDARILEDVCERLCAHGDIDATEIEVKVADREVTLSGSVGSRWEKRLAEDTAEEVSGVSEVHNQLRVSQGTFGRPGGNDPAQADRPGRAA